MAKKEQKFKRYSIETKDEMVFLVFYDLTIFYHYIEISILSFGKWKEKYSFARRERMR